MRNMLMAATLAAALLMSPATVVAQDDVVTRLRDVLPAEVADQVIGTVAEALARGLPGQAIANRALEGVAKGRSGEEVLAAAQDLAGDLAAAQEAITRSGRDAGAAEIEAATQAMQLGVDGEAISALASSAPSGRSLTVPLAVIGALAGRGLPSDDAIAAVQARLQARAGDVELAMVPAEVEQMLAQGMRPNEVGLALAAARAGIAIPVGGIGVPLGPPSGVPVNGGAQGQRPTPPVSPPVQPPVSPPGS